MRPDAFPPDWLIPDWPAPPGVRALCTTRHGGFSVAPYDRMNLGDHVGDVPARVAANRALLSQSAGAAPVFLRQVHGTSVLTLDGSTADGRQADAAITTQRGVACTIMVADCLPVLLTNVVGTGGAAAHAGWRGLAGRQGTGVLEEVYNSLCALSVMDKSQEAIQIIAWLGPCIGPDVFEVGSEVRAAFVAGDAQAARCFRPHGPGKYLADLPGLARLRLQAMGITRIHGNDGSAPWCTVGNSSRFFSHRRDAGVQGNGFNTTGRMAACIWRE
jgi:YfiH family protein